MKKKLTYIIALTLLFVVPESIMAQNVEKSVISSKDSMSIVVDSLQQITSKLKTTIKKKSDDDHNRSIWNNRAKYFNLSYVNQSLTLKEANVTWRSDIGAALTVGRTFYLHKKPILNMIKFGIDWSYLDINFASYKDKFNFIDGGNYENNDDYYYEETNSPGDDDKDHKKSQTTIYQGEIGMQVGPSITINPIDHLKINGYFRFAPSAAVLVPDEGINVNYASFFVLGGAVSYKVISLGVEGRWGTTKYNSMTEDDGENSDYSNEEFDSSNYNNMSWKTGAIRFYVSFRF